jgi:hypothetical protein
MIVLIIAFTLGIGYVTIKDKPVPSQSSQEIRENGTMGKR